MESGLTRRAEMYIDPGDHHYRSRAVGAVRVRRITEPRMGPYLPCVRRNFLLLVGERLSSSYEGGGPLWSSNQSAILANGTGASTPLGAVSIGENSLLFPRLSNF